MLGDRVEHGDVVDVAGKRQDRSKPLIYLAYYKPRGVVTHSPTPGQRSIADAEGITGIITEVTLKMHKWPEAIISRMIGFRELGGARGDLFGGAHVRA